MRYVHRIVFTLVAAATCARAGTSDVVVVTSTRSPALSLSREQVADIFLGRNTRLPDGRRAVPIDHGEGMAIRDAFYLAFTGKSPAQIKAHWSKVIFTGRGHPPKQAADGNEVKQRLSRNPDAIAYLEAALLDSSVQVVTVQ
jgi:ABC-type phosphate transport system substrate-binding protein